MRTTTTTASPFTPLSLLLLSRRHFSLSATSPTFPHPYKTPHPHPKLKFISSQFLSLTKTPKTLSQLDSTLSHLKSFDATTSVAALHSLSQLRKLTRAKTVLFHLKDNLKVSPYFLFSLVFDCLVKDGNLDHFDVNLNVNLCDYVIHVCKFGDVDEIKCVCERVLSGKVILERYCYLSLIGALCRFNEGKMAKLVIKEMYVVGVRVDDVSYVVVCQCLCRSGELDEADWVLRKMVQEGYYVDVCVYEGFMIGLCKEGKFREADKLFRKLLKRDYCVDRGGRVRFLKEGRRAVFQLKCEGVVPEMLVYEMYFRGLCRAGRLGDAEILLRKMMKKREVVQVCVYGDFIEALFKAGREEDAMKFFKVECKKGLVAPDEMARFVVIQLCEKGQVDEAMRIFDEFAKNSVSVNSVDLCNCLLSSLWSSGKAEQAEMYFERMNDGLLVPPNLLTYKLLVCGFCDQGKLARMLSIFEEMLSKNIPIDWSTSEIVIGSLCKHGWHGEAYKYLDAMVKSGCIVSYTVWKRLFWLLLRTAEVQRSVDVLL